jgi:hypothetical protein
MGGGLRVFASGAPHGEDRRGCLEIPGGAQFSAPVAADSRKETSITFLLSDRLIAVPGLPIPLTSVSI